MDITQVVLGIVLIAGGVVTFVSPTLLDSTLLVSVLALTTVVASGAFLRSVARNE